MKIKNMVAAAGIAVAVAAGTAACAGVGGYQQAYVVGRTMCPDQYGNMQTCVIMSDGDLVAVQSSIWNTIMYGMMLQSYSGGYHFIRPPASYNIHVHNVSVTSYSSYSKTHTSVKAVTPSSEASQEKTGNTYNSGGSSYKSSPVYKANAAAAKSGYSSSKTGYSSTKSGYSSYKSGSSTSRISQSSGYKSGFSSSKSKW